MKKTYVLKSWDEVANHHFIAKERWDALTNRELEVEFLEGFLSTSAIIYPKGERATITNSYLVVKDDLREVVNEAPKNEPTKANADTVKEIPKRKKTYTKNDIRSASARVMANIEDETEAIISANTLAKLIKELN